MTNLTTPEEGAKGDGLPDPILRQLYLDRALAAAEKEARALASDAGINWLFAKRLADTYYGPAIRHETGEMLILMSRAATAEAEAQALRERVARLEGALKRIAGSNTFDMDSLHPDACAHVARAALNGGPDA